MYGFDRRSVKSIHYRPSSGMDNWPKVTAPGAEVQHFIGSLVPRFDCRTRTTLQRLTIGAPSGRSARGGASRRSADLRWTIAPVEKGDYRVYRPGQHCDNLHHTRRRDRMDRCRGARPPERFGSMLPGPSVLFTVTLDPDDQRSLKWVFEVSQSAFRGDPSEASSAHPPDNGQCT